MTGRPLELFPVMLMMTLGESNYYYYDVHFTDSETEPPGAYTSCSRSHEVSEEAEVLSQSG